MPSLLLVGDLKSEIPQPALEFAGRVKLLRAQNLSQATRMLADRAQPGVDVIVLADARGAEFTDAALAPIRKLAPLARVWRLLGTWCEGEVRSGHPPAGCVRTYWHQWPARFARELDVLANGGTPGWALPLTAGLDERIAANVATLPAERRGTVVIIASRAPAAAALADACRGAGYDTLVEPEDGRFRLVGAKAIVWDTEVERIVHPTAVAELRSRAPGAPLVAVVGFPRVEDVEDAHRAGIHAVISKPYLTGDLLWHLERAVSQVADQPVEQCHRGIVSTSPSAEQSSARLAK